MGIRLLSVDEATATQLSQIPSVEVIISRPSVQTIRVSAIGRHAMVSLIVIVNLMGGSVIILRGAGDCGV